MQIKGYNKINVIYILPSKSTAVSTGRKSK